MTVRHLLALTLVVLSSAVPAPRLLGNELRAAVGEFLETGATASAESLWRAQSQYRQLRSRVPNDDRVEYACALVLINQRRYANALPLLARQVSRSPADFEASCWHVWALVQNRRYAEALSAIDQLGSRIADTTLSSDNERRSALLKLGRFLGYFERVRPSGISAEEILRIKNRLLATLSPDDVKLLDEGTALTATRFDELAAARQQQLASRAASSDAARNSAAESLERQKSQAANSQAERDTKAGESNDAVRQWAVLQTQIARLTQDRARVSAQIATVQALLQQFYGRTDVDFGTIGRGANEYDFRGQLVLPQDVIRVQQLALQLASLNKQAFDMDRKLLDYGRQAEGLKAVGAAQGDAAIRNEQLRQDAMKRAAQLDKRLRQLEREKPAQAATMTAQMRSLSTYVPFDYESERVRVLAWFD